MVDLEDESLTEEQLLAINGIRKHSISTLDGAGGTGKISLKNYVNMLIKIVRQLKHLRKLPLQLQHMLLKRMGLIKLKLKI